MLPADFPHHNVDDGHHQQRGRKPQGTHKRLERCQLKKQTQPVAEEIPCRIDSIGAIKPQRAEHVVEQQKRQSVIHKREVEPFYSFHYKRFRVINVAGTEKITRHEIECRKVVLVDKPLYNRHTAMACYHRDDGQAFHNIENIVTLLCCHFITPTVFKICFIVNFNPRRLQPYSPKRARRQLKRPNYTSYILLTIFMFFFLIC